MKKKKFRFLRSALSLLTASSLMLTVSCTSSPTPSSEDASGENAPAIDPPVYNASLSLTGGLTASSVPDLSPDECFTRSQTAFAVKLFQETLEKDTQGNLLISPASVAIALTMTANGAGGNTLAQMESLLGQGIDLYTLNRYLHTAYFSGESADDIFKLADSIWFRDTKDFTVNEAFLQKNKDYLSAEIFRSPFDDNTVEDINRWCNYKTDGMIPHLLDELEDRDMMHLLNAVAFEGNWAKNYENESLRTGVFRAADGTEQTVTMMTSQEGQYLSDGKATGFVKYYEGYRYAFVALLPGEGITPDDYVASLTGEGLSAMFLASEHAEVTAAMPKFSCNYSADLVPIMKAMGMREAFDGDNADFSGIGTLSDGNLCIGSINHKTHITVDEMGTKAAAVTDIGMVRATALRPDEKHYEVTLDRPFVYMILDTTTNVPLFMGTVDSISQ